MYADDPRLLIGRKHAEVSHVARRIARWSAGAAAATWAFRDIATARGGHGLFASLNADARTALACLAEVPISLPLILFVFALYLNYGSFYAGVRETLVGTKDRFRISGERGVLVNSLIRGLPLVWRRWQVFGWWLVAGLAGAATVAITGALLSTRWSGWLVWASVAGVGLCVATLERVLTEWRYRVVIPRRPKNPQEALRRAREWQALRPGDTSAMPWIYAHSGLATEEIEEEFGRLGTSGPVGFTHKVLGLVAVVLFYSALPAPDVSRFSSEGMTGCLFGSVHGFAGVAEENLGLSMLAGAILLLLMPISALIAYLRFMIRYHFPPQAVAQVLAREAGFALVLPIYSVVMIAVLGLAIALLMWGSAAVANAWDSPVAGTVVLVVPVTLIVWAVTRAKTRGPLPR